MKRKTIDRRRNGRVEMSNPALVSMPGRTPLTDAPAVMVDLSSTGMRLHMWTAPQKHRIASVRIDLDGEVYSVSGRVVRVDPADEGGHLVGIEFDPASLIENPFPTCAMVDQPALRSKASKPTD
ncbi:MAG: PilZ domain-containing protein [Planctomycetota bacterium]